MRVVRLMIIVVACWAWLSPTAQAGQRGHVAGGGGRSGGAGTSRGQEGPPSAQGRSSGETRGGSANDASSGPFVSRLGMAPRRSSSPWRRPFFGGGRGFGLPWFDPLWWTEVPPAYEGPQDPDELRGASRGGPPPAPILPSGPSSIQPLDSSRPPALAVSSTSGTLRFNVEPGSAQLYVDGFYVGNVEDFSGSSPGLRLPLGWHRLEFRAPGFLTPAVNVTIGPDRPTVYEGKLQPIQR